MQLLMLGGVLGLFATGAAHIWKTDAAQNILTTLQGLEPGSFKSAEMTLPIPASSYQLNYVEPAVDAQVHIVRIGSKVHDYFAEAPVEADGPRPAIVLLHGAKRTGASMIDMWRKTAKASGAVLLAPNSSGVAWSASDDPDQMFDALLDDAKSRYSIDPDRIYLFGHSSGAIRALDLTLTRSDVFAATALHAGVPGAQHLQRLADASRRATRIAILLGSDDHIFPTTRAVETGKAVAEAGHHVTYVEIKGHNHWYYSAAGTINDRVWEYLSLYDLQNIYAP